MYVTFHVPFDSSLSILLINTSSDVAPIKFPSVASIKFICLTPTMTQLIEASSAFTIATSVILVFILVLVLVLVMILLQIILPRFKLGRVTRLVLWFYDIASSRPTIDYVYESLSDNNNQACS